MQPSICQKSFPIKTFVLYDTKIDKILYWVKLDKIMTVVVPEIDQEKAHLGK